MFYQDDELILEEKEVKILNELNHSMEEALEKFNKVSVLTYCSTQTELYFKLNIPGIENICVSVTRLQELITHNVSFNVALYSNYQNKIERLNYDGNFVSISLKKIVYGLNSGFSYIYTFAPDSLYIYKKMERLK